MKVFRALFFAALVVGSSVTLVAQGRVINPYIFATGGGGGGPTFLLNQGAEGTGYDNGPEVWIETGSVDEDYVTAPAPLVGSQSIYGSGTTLRLTSPTFTGQDEGWLKFRIHPVTFPAATTPICTFIGPNWGLDRFSDGTVRTSGSVNSGATINAMATGSAVWVRLHYIKDLDGGAGSAIASVEFNSSGTFDGTGNDFQQFSNGTETAQVTAVRFFWESGVSTVTHIIDSIQFVGGPTPPP